MYGLFIYSTVLKKSIIRCNVKHVLYINRKITVASITLLMKNLHKFDKNSYLSHDRTFNNVRENRTLSVRWTIIYGGSCIISSTEFHRMGYHRAFLRGSSSRSVLSTTSTNCRYIKRFVLRNFFRVQCINVKEVVWGPVETSDTRRRAIKDGQLFIAVSIQTCEKYKGQSTLRIHHNPVHKIQFHW